MKLKVGNRVVYPGQGVGQVHEIVEKRIGGQKLEFYVLEMQDGNSTVMVPSQNLEQVGLRKLSDQEDMDQLFEMLGAEDTEPNPDWKQRYQQNLENMQSGNLLRTGHVLKELCVLSERKKLGLRDQKMLEQAEHFVVSEIAAIESIGEAEARNRIQELLGVTLEPEE